MPRLTPAKRDLVATMLRDGRYTIRDIAGAVGCALSTARRVRASVDHFGTPESPLQHGGLQRLITPDMQDALRQLLVEQPDRYLEEMEGFLADKFAVRVSGSTLSKTLARMGWSKKVSRRRAKERDPDLRDFYMYKISSFHSWQLVFIDESGCDKLTGLRRTAWSPRGVTPVQVAQFHRGKRFQILPAYTQDGVLLYKIFQGTTDSNVFEDFIELLLPLCGRWPEPRSVLVMDNASIHRSSRIQQMCDEAGVLLLYLPPYSPDFNPIEEFFAELKGFIRRHWTMFTLNPDQGFGTFLRWCIEEVGSRGRSARGHFRHSGLTVEEP